MKSSRPQERESKSEGSVRMGRTRHYRRGVENWERRDQVDTEERENSLARWEGGKKGGGERGKDETDKTRESSQASYHPPSVQ